MINLVNMLHKWGENITFILYEELWKSFVETMADKVAYQKFCIVKGKNKWTVD